MTHAENVNQAIDLLRRGVPVAFPTETVYGLGAIATDEDAVRVVFGMKGRPSNNPLIVHVPSIETAEGLTDTWDDRCKRLSQVFWPGPLTLVVPRAPSIPDAVTAGLSTVGLRCPDHPVALELLTVLGEPLVGPSANRSGAVSPTTADHVRAGFGEDAPFVLDGGPCRTGIESTVLDCSGETPRVLRPGVIGHDAISEALGTEVKAWAAGARAEIVASPGLLGPHYRPDAPVLLIDPDAIGAEHKTVFLLRTAERPEKGWAIRLPEDPEGYAAELYAALRLADRFSPARILIERPPTDDPDPKLAAIWRAVNERLSRAAAG
ncbi:MAG: L-threonylcarbamoyladenylate synthase [Planctomycetota bacterium]